MVFASLTYIILGNIKDKLISYKRGFIWTLLLCTIIFIGYKFALSIFENSRPHKYYISIVQGDGETIQIFKDLEEAYPDKIIHVESLKIFKKLVHL